MYNLYEGLSWRVTFLINRSSRSDDMQSREWRAYLGKWFSKNTVPMKEQYVLLAIYVHRKKNFSFVWKKSHFLCSEIRKKKKKRTNEQTNLWCVYFGRSFRRFFLSFPSSSSSSSSRCCCCSSQLQRPEFVSLSCLRAGAAAASLLTSCVPPSLPPFLLFPPF